MKTKIKILVKPCFFLVRIAEGKYLHEVINTLPNLTDKILHWLIISVEVRRLLYYLS